MPQCKKCGKKGLFLKIEEDSGLCLSCNEAFAKEGKTLTEQIIKAKSAANAATDPKEVATQCGAIEAFGNKLIALHEAFGLQPSQELLDLIQTHKKMREMAER
jgi:hypothetical protein